MLAQFSVWPLDDVHMSREIANIAEVLDQTGADYQIGPMGTTVQGEWHAVMEAIQACHEAVRGSHQRVLTTITIDDDSTRPLQMREATAKVNAHRQQSTT